MKWMIPAAAALALAATPAFAAGQNDNDIINNAVKNSKSQSQNSDSQSSDRSARNDNSSQTEWSGHPHRNVRAMSQRKLRNALKDAGFTNIRVLDAKYLIQAKDDNGNTVFMAINPPSLNNAGAETTGSASGSPSNGGANSNAQANNDQSDSGSDSWNYRRSYNFDDSYNSGYDQGYREGYNRGYDSGSRY